MFFWNSLVFGWSNGYWQFDLWLLACISSLLLIYCFVECATICWFIYLWMGIWLFSIFGRKEMTSLQIGTAMDAWKHFSFEAKKKPVTVHSGCCNKTRQQKFIAHSSRGWKSKIRVPDGQGRVRFLVQSLSAFSHDERGEGLSEVCFMRALILFVRVAPSWPNHLAKAPSSNAITWDLRILTCGSGAVIGGHKHSYPSKKEE